MTREEAITVLKAFMENPLFSEVHKAAFNIAIHDIKAYHDWNINNLILVNKDNYEAPEQEPTTKNDHHKQNIQAYAHDFSVSEEQAEKELLVTTKNDLGVDCISRADARSLICNTDIKHHLFGMTRKAFKDLYNGIDELHSVTPTRPKGHWTEEFNDLEGEVRFTCSSCGKYQLFGTDFCYHCGSDNREVVEG